MRVPRAALGGAARTLLVFDLDGTLLDSLEDLAGSVNAVRRRHRLEVLAAEVVRDHIGDGAPALVARTLPEVIATGIPLEQLVEEFRADYRERCVIHPRLLPGARSLLDRARERGFTLALLSNKPVDMSLR
ncbi:MAG: HAD family hydrolase, partial [Planctomycetota bacterium]